MLNLSLFDVTIPLLLTTIVVNSNSKMTIILLKIYYSNVYCYRNMNYSKFALLPFAMKTLTFAVK